MERDRAVGRRGQQRPEDTRAVHDLGSSPGAHSTLSPVLSTGLGQHPPGARPAPCSDPANSSWRLRALRTSDRRCGTSRQAAASPRTARLVLQEPLMDGTHRGRGGHRL